MEMDGKDEMEVEVYKEKGEHWKKGRKKRKEIEGRTLIEENEQYYFYINLVSFRVLMGA